MKKVIVAFINPNGDIKEIDMTYAEYNALSLVELEKMGCKEFGNLYTYYAASVYEE